MRCILVLDVLIIFSADFTTLKIVCNNREYRTHRDCYRFSSKILFYNNHFMYSMDYYLLPQ